MRPMPDHAYTVEVSSDISEEIEQRQKGLPGSENAWWTREAAWLESWLILGLGDQRQLVWPAYCLTKESYPDEIVASTTI